MIRIKSKGIENIHQPRFMLKFILKKSNWIIFSIALKVLGILSTFTNIFPVAFLEIPKIIIKIKLASLLDIWKVISKTYKILNPKKQHKL